MANQLPPQKKSRLVPPSTEELTALSKPAIVSGIVSASKSGSYTDEKPLEIDAEDCNSVDEFFPLGTTTTTTSVDQAPIVSFTKGWKERECREKQVRDDVFVFLRQQGIHFPDNSATTEKPSEYREKFLKTIFAGCAKKSNESIDDINRTAQGLKTTMTSQPDMCVLREEDIIVGELKQASHYSVEGAQRQCAVYAYAVLYFYRVILGYPVDHAYGFWVCGPKTGGVEANRYSIGFIKVVAPQKVGDLFHALRYGKSYNVDDEPGGLELLVHFLKEGNKMVTAGIGNNVDKKQQPRDKRKPCLFSLPTSLWPSTLKEFHGVETTLGGTCAMVFCVSVQNLEAFINQYVTSSEELRLFIERQLKPWLALQKSGDAATKVFVKVRTKDTSVNFQPLEFRAVWDNVKDEINHTSNTEGKACTGREAFDDFLNTYIIKPFDKSEEFSLCVMGNRGKPFNPAKVSDGLDLLLQNFIDRVKGISAVVSHGDVLLHNVVHDEVSNTLHLIDFDESVRKSTTLAKRSLDTSLNPSMQWFQALMYPNALRKCGKFYTQVQLLAFVCQVRSNVNQISGMPWEPIKELGTLLQRNNSAIWSKSDKIPGEVKKLIEDLCQVLPRFKTP
jgi:hypothetical protein